MIEQALLDGLTNLLRDLALQPTPTLIGVIEPAVSTDLPALVLSLEASQRLGNGLGERSSLVQNSALTWSAPIDLAHPFLPGDTSFSLVSPDRRTLTLPHGGLVRKDSSSGPLGAADLQVTVGGAPRTLVAGSPGPNEFTADPLVGTLTFGEPLPATGSVQATYVLGQWEQRTVRSSGILRLDLLASDGSGVQRLSDAVLAAFDQPAAAVLPGLSQLAISDIGSIAPAAPPLDAARRRTIRFRFEFEQLVNVPDSSGGVIRRIPIQALVG